MADEKKTPAKAKESKGQNQGGGNKFLNWLKNLPQRIATPFRNMAHELKRVTWPSKQKTITYSIIVLVFILFMMVVIGLFDLASTAVINIGMPQTTQTTAASGNTETGDTETKALTEEAAQTTVETPAEESVETPAEESVETLAEESVETPVDETVETPVDETVETPVDETVETPVDETVETPVDETVETPVDETVETPKDNALSDEAKAIAGSWKTAGDAPAVLTLNDDATFTLTQGEKTVEGTWSFADNQATLTPNGEDAAPCTLAFNAEDGTLTLADAENGDLVFAREQE